MRFVLQKSPVPLVDIAYGRGCSLHSAAIGSSLSKAGIRVLGLLTVTESITLHTINS